MGCDDYRLLSIENAFMQVSKGCQSGAASAYSRKARDAKQMVRIAFKRGLRRYLYKY